jgi:hypothetical protein
MTVRGRAQLLLKRTLTHGRLGVDSDKDSFGSEPQKLINNIISDEDVGMNGSSSSCYHGVRVPKHAGPSSSTRFPTIGCRSCS